MDLTAWDREVEAANSCAFAGIIGRSPAMQRVLSLVQKLSLSDTTVLLSGESGTGKELIARTIHNLSVRSSESFVPVNCAAIPEDLLESELFGHIKGAFTGAINPRQGRFQLADEGTVFLDEIGEMRPHLQVKLLRVLQEREFEPVGSDKTTQVNVRVIAATNRDLGVEVQEKRFREDLFYRLNVIPIKLPPLRERVEDIPELIAHFLIVHSKKKKKVIEKIEDDAVSLLTKYDWPGNVRELENLMERLVVLNEDGTVRLSDLPEHIVCRVKEPKVPGCENALALPEDGMDLDGFLKSIENDLILQALARTRGNKTLAAEFLGLNRTTLIERMRKRGLLEQAEQFSAHWSYVRKSTVVGLPLTALA